MPSSRFRPIHSGSTRRPASVLLGALVIACALAAHAGALAQQPGAALHLVVVFDGLRADSVNAADTPNLFRLSKEGVAFANSHSVFPTVTRVNAASLGTGSYPSRHGITGNALYVPALDPQRAISNESVEFLLRLDRATGGRMVTARAMADILAESDRRMVAIGSGTRGGLLLLAPKAPLGTGAIVSGNFVAGGRVAYPDALNDALLHKLGPPRKDAAADWVLRALHEYVLPEMRPAVVVLWFNEPDHAQHTLGAGAPKAVAAIREHDAMLGLVLERLEALGLREKTNVIALSDHGFAHTAHVVNVAEELVAAGLMDGAAPQSVVFAANGQAVSLYVERRDPQRVRAIAEFLQRQPWAGAIFTAASAAGGHEGVVPGTLALEYVHVGGHERSPDIVLTFRWSDEANVHRVPGADYAFTSGQRKTGPVTGARATHGGLSPWTVRNVMIASGPDFQRAAVVATPSSNVDIAPTLLHLLGLGEAAKDMDGRVLVEALAADAGSVHMPAVTRVLRVHAGGYRAALQITEYAGKRYVDKAWRE